MISHLPGHIQVGITNMILNVGELLIINSSYDRGFKPNVACNQYFSYTCKLTFENYTPLKLGPSKPLIHCIVPLLRGFC